MLFTKVFGYQAASVILSTREDFEMVNYQTITVLVNQIPAGTWDVLREIKERRPAMMLSELIECRRRALREQGPSEPRSQTARPSDTPSL